MGGVAVGLVLIDLSLSLLSWMNNFLNGLRFIAGMTPYGYLSAGAIKMLWLYMKAIGRATLQIHIAFFAYSKKGYGSTRECNNGQ